MTEPWEPWDISEPEEERTFTVVPLTPEQERDVKILVARQEVFGRVVDALIAIYRDFDRTRRAVFKERMKELYERLKELGETIGVARTGLDHLWRG